MERTRFGRQQLDEAFAEGVGQATEYALQYIASHYLSECDMATLHAALTDCEAFILKNVESKKKFNFRKKGLYLHYGY